MHTTIKSKLLRPETRGSRQKKSNDSMQVLIRCILSPVTTGLLFAFVIVICIRCILSPVTTGLLFAFAGISTRLGHFMPIRQDLISLDLDNYKKDDSKWEQYKGVFSVNYTYHTDIQTGDRGKMFRGKQGNTWTGNEGNLTAINEEKTPDLTY